ncbi:MULTISPECIES: hypothetical protein [unclassified Novosphingobium]|uniref:hypothetical protein n=1 Tax=unclassified Novosphingobium TaxID=2644732 RepID=UPI001358A064|nr:MULTISPECIES: hypothetical protein [unclassified Novosphingobium]
MSLFAFAAFAAAATASAAPHAHSVQLDHRGSTYQVDYRAHVETRTRTIGMSPPTRPSSQRCVLTANVSVERVIGGQAGHELKAMLPGKESFTRYLPGDCRNRQDQLAKLVEDKSQAIGAHLARAAVDDHQSALAAIETAHHFAAN